MDLDVGCGISPKGDVNVNLFLEGYSSRKENLKHEIISNLVKADIHYLPFRNDIFDNSFCYHVIEHHGVRAISAINELIRVTKNMLEVEVPHRVSGYCKSHNKYFSCLSFRRLLKSMGLSFSFQLNRKCIPHDFLCLVRKPISMRVRIPCGG